MTPKFTDNMGKAIKKLIVLAGGTPEKNLFSEGPAISR